MASRLPHFRHLERLSRSKNTFPSHAKNIHSTVSRCATAASSSKVNVSKEGNAQKPNLPREADVVVIGGGSLGCSTLYSLAKLGVKNTVLLEANQLTAGTTWHTAGLIWSLRPNDVEIELLRTTRSIISSLEEETGVHPGWINNGGLFIASTKERLDEYKRLMTIGRAKGVESYILDPSETKELYPLMDVSHIYGTLYSPADGTIEPAGLCTALIRSATRAGAKLYENCPVTSITTEPTTFGGTRVKEIITPFGSIKTNNIVNATGCWANYISQMVGVEVPLVTMKHAYVVTEKINGIENMPNVRDHDSSVYLRLQGDALSIGGYEVNPDIIDKIERDFHFGLFELDWNIFSAHIEGAVKLIPTLEQTGIKSTVCGPESFTPDHKPLMGEDPNVSGFYHCCGFNSAGMMLGGGSGYQMAHWIVNGRPIFDMFGYDIRRFHPTATNNHNWVVSRSHEAYAKNYAIVFPHDEPLAGRGFKKIPLHDALEENGCVFQERHGWERPGWFNTHPTVVSEYDWYGAYDNSPSKNNSYKDALQADYTFDFPLHHDIIRNECMATRTAAALFDMSYFGQIYITGPDAQRAADWLFTANMQKEAGNVVYTCMLNDQGRVEADLTVSVLDGRSTCKWEPHFQQQGFYLAIGGGATLQNKAHILKEARRNHWNIEIVDQTDKMGVISLQGPLSRDILQQIANTDLSNEAFPFSSHRILNVAGHEVRALRISFVGEMGWELHVPAESANSVYQAIHSAGRSYNLINGGYRALDSLSCEKGYVLWHSDLRPDDTPLEAGLGFTCKLKTSIPFKGREFIEKQKLNKIRRKLVTLTLDNPNIPLHGLEGIKRDGEYVGLVRRGEYAFYLGTPIARGYIERPCGSPLTSDFLYNGKWEIDVMGNLQSATIHKKNPFDPMNLRIQGFYDKSNEIKEQSVL